MARGNCKPNNPCGMSQGIYNPFFQNGEPWYGQGGSDPSYTTEYQAVINRGITLGYPLPSVVQRAKQNQIIIDLKSSGAWNLLDFFYVFATDGDLNFAKINWKTPTLFEATSVGSIAFTPNQGFAGNGSNSYLTTNFIPSTNGVNFTQNNASYGIYCFDNVLSGSGVVEMGSENTGGNSAYIQVRGTSNAYAGRCNDAANLSSTNTTSVGLSSITRTASNARALYKNGVQLTSDAQASQARTSFAMFLGCLNTNGSTFGFSTKKMSVAFAGSGNINQLNVYNALNTYINSL